MYVTFFYGIVFLSATEGRGLGGGGVVTRPILKKSTVGKYILILVFEHIESSNLSDPVCSIALDSSIIYIDSFTLW